MSLSDSIVKGMRATTELFCSKAVRMRDKTALDHVYTADAQILPPGSDMLQGIAGIKSLWLSTITSLDVKDASLSTVSADSAGDTVVEIGRAELTLAGSQKVPVNVSSARPI